MLTEQEVVSAHQIYVAQDRRDREHDADVKQAHAAVKAFQDCRHPPATKRAAWLYGIYGHRQQNGLSSSHLDLAHELEPFVSATTGACHPGFDRLLALINRNRAVPWTPSTLTKRLTDLVRWGHLVRTDGSKPRPKSLCVKGGIGSVFVLAAPDGDWEKIVKFYRRRDIA